MDVNALRKELSIRCKNGLPFLLAATVIWCIILVIFLAPFTIRTKNILTFYATGIMLPLSIGISKVIKAEWKVDDHPFGILGLYLNLAQLMYFPLLFWAFSHHPAQMIMFFAVITGAHFFPYGWYYHTKAYSIMAPVISIVGTVLGWTINETNLWYIPMMMVIAFILLSFWLYVDYKGKVHVDRSEVCQ